MIKYHCLYFANVNTVLHKYLLISPLSILNSKYNKTSNPSNKIPKFILKCVVHGISYIEFKYGVRIDYFAPSRL